VRISAVGPEASRTSVAGSSSTVGAYAERKDVDEDDIAGLLD
jgi:hypothetical protein